MREDFRKRLAKEYRLAVTKMQEAKHPARKLYYFSVLFGEATRILNWEWDRELVLIELVTQHVHTQVNAATQASALGQVLPIEGATVYAQLTQTASDLATYMEKAGGKDNKEELCHILERFAEIAYAVSGNGSYLYEKGLIKF